jgi:hypothetical protein
MHTCIATDPGGDLGVSESGGGSLRHGSQGIALGKCGQWESGDQLEVTSHSEASGASHILQGITIQGLRLIVTAASVCGVLFEGRWSG